MPATLIDRTAGKTTFDCVRCGRYALTSEAEAFLEGRSLSSPRQIANISGYIRENQGLTIFERDLDYVADRPMPSVTEKAMKVLVAFATESPEPGAEFYPRYAGQDSLFQLQAMLTDGVCTPERCDSDVVSALKLMAICWAESDQEMMFLVEDYLGGQGYLRAGLANGQVITPEGWALIDQLKRGAIDSDKGFVAMSFRDDLKSVFDDGLYPGILAAGYDAIRIDRVEHNNKIDDEIVAAIRGCKFLVADFTVDRGGIYFEAGLALGLGKTVIWTVREDKLHDVHFDNRQYNFVRWLPERLPEFAQALQNRIEATIGKGPLRHGI